MPGLIRDDDIAEVRERANIDDVVSAHVSLRNAGGGSQKGLCPFHDERTPSFHVTPSRGFYHCFGCGESGDVFTFLMKLEGLSFVEAAERLGEKYGVELRRVDGDAPERPRGPGRGRLLEAHQVAAEYYVEQLRTPDAAPARQFLTERGFDQAAAEHFGLGFAPRDGEALTRHLRGRRFTDEESVAAGLVALGRSHYDRFRGRLLWPIREAGGDTIGFGARRIFDDDRIEAKYLNTPETAIYKKSHVLYGLDLAFREIKSTRQAVVVEGYTDVMAAHLAGVRTAVASCGTAFGAEHAKLLGRYLDDHVHFRGEVVFTFDGDQAGRDAAVKAFQYDHALGAQSYVAVDPDGLDPCDLRLKGGDESVRELMARRQPLYRFVLRNVVDRYDLDRADSRVDALREAAAVLASLKDRSKVEAFTREVAAMIGVDIDEARIEVRRAGGAAASSQRRESDRRTPSQAAPAPQVAPRPQVPSTSAPAYSVERDTLKLVVQQPGALGRSMSSVDVDDFTHPTFRGLWAVVVAAGGPPAGADEPDSWAGRLHATAEDPAVAAAIRELGVEPLRTHGPASEAYVAEHVLKLLELTTLRRIADLKSRLQRTNPVEQATVYNRMFGELVALEQHRRALRERMTT